MLSFTIYNLQFTMRDPFSVFGPSWITVNGKRPVNSKRKKVNVHE